ncbi:conserved hypothetical protein [Paraburkholderia unamae]|nr:conserved hypothetical protein [Paraburkholderia unamae]
MGGGKGGACVIPARRVTGGTAGMEPARIPTPNEVATGGAPQCAPQPATQQLAPQ